MPKQQKIRKKNQQKISQNWPKLAISVTKRLIEDMEPSLLQLVDIGQNQGVISTISVSDCWNWNWQFQFWWLSVLTTFSFDHLQFWPPSVFTTFNFDHFQFWPPSILATFSFDQFWPLSVLTATPPPLKAHCDGGLVGCDSASQCIAASFLEATAGRRCWRKH